MKNATTLAALAAVGIAAAAAHAQSITTVTYDFPAVANGAYSFGWFGGNNPVSGWIVKTRVVLDYTAGPGINAADFESRFDVPVLDPLGGSAQIGISGTKLGWSGEGQFSFSTETDDYNGEIRTGRFGWELLGGGTIQPGSRIEFDVSSVPAPPALSLVVAGLLIGCRRRR